ncbi:metallophosphoesterase family protein [Liquorilactobacillus hordei]|uniref:Metallophosphatase family protein n=2 Tax=Liquorilactobacillus hordei TaxID=468911 RepID=A0A3S6QP65_9LACO|nr:metallophosphoesterase family protein [Liquorilactobacillus hordei]AUJ29814.1 metallophosphatase family protein [Liquorilactobacillus hordei]
MTHKIALLSDVHGNQTALAAVLADAKKNNVDECWFLGDLIMPGPGCEKLFEMLDENNTTLYIRGNWDDCLLEVLDPETNIDLNDPSDVYVGILSKYIYDNINHDYIKRIKEFKLHSQKKVANLLISISHNLPTKNYGAALMMNAKQENFNELFSSEDVDIAVYGHIHSQLLRYSEKSQLIINPGTIGQPFSTHNKFLQDRRAQYAILEIDEIGFVNLEFRHVAYDTEKELTFAKNNNLPYYELYQELLETGITHTHDLEVLSKFNQQNNYIEVLKGFLEKLK